MLEKSIHARMDKDTVQVELMRIGDRREHRNVEECSYFEEPMVTNFAVF